MFRHPRGSTPSVYPVEAHDLFRTLARIARELLQVRAAVHALKDLDAATAEAACDYVLALLAEERNAAWLVHAEEELLHELELGRDGEDGERVAARVDLGADIAVRRVEVLLRERCGDGRQDELACAPDGAGGLLVRQDAEVGNECRLDDAAGRRCERRQRVLRQAVVELVQYVEVAVCMRSGKQRALAGRHVPSGAMWRGPEPGPWSTEPAIW